MRHCHEGKAVRRHQAAEDSKPSGQQAPFHRGQDMVSDVSLTVLQENNVFKNHSTPRGD